MQQIVLASNNLGKIKEFQALFKILTIEIVPQSEFNVPEIDEPYTTFFENALHKARHCSYITQLPALADDSGLCVEALNGAPGIYSARYAGEPKNDANNRKKLLKDLENIENRRAYFYCTLVLLQSHLDPAPLFAEGKLYGTIITKELGSNGFGYDQLFYLEQYQQTTAQLDPTLKNQISHRALALKNLFNQLKGTANATY
jgi:XTP/dITP diphosphohydrolase